MQNTGYVISDKVQFCYILYHERKHHFILQHLMQVVYFTLGQEGSASDSTIYKESDFKRLLDEGTLNFPDVCANDKLKVPYHLVGDDGFELSKTLMKVTISPYQLYSCGIVIFFHSIVITCNSKFPHCYNFVMQVKIFHMDSEYFSYFVTKILMLPCDTF